jgi:hypothetical protein
MKFVVSKMSATLMFAVILFFKNMISSCYSMINCVEHKLEMYKTVL